MDQTNRYYTNNAKSFADSTFKLHNNMSTLYQMFLKNVYGNRILDVGCGSGRDSVYFQTLGFDVTGLERNVELAKIASSNGVDKVICQDIINYHPTSLYDGIWACASLLHVNKTYLTALFGQLYNMLTSKGVLYCSFKYGNFEGYRNGRYFVDLTESTFNQLIQYSEFAVREMMITNDVRDDNKQQWLNIILAK